MKVCTFNFPYWDTSKQKKCFVLKVAFFYEAELKKYKEMMIFWKQ
jgi:hypothetical protein